MILFAETEFGREKMAEGPERVIPIVDLRALCTDPKSDPEPELLLRVGQQLTDAFSDIGFAYITNHGVPDELIRKTFQCTGEFFELPLAEKEKFAVENSHGYVVVNREKLGGDSSRQELRESFDILYNEDRYPDALVPEFRPSMRQLFEAFNCLAQKLLQALQYALDVKDNVLVKSHSHILDSSMNITIMRALYYPPVPAQIPPGALRCGEHSDYGTITILAQDNLGGLEVKTRSGVWKPADPIDGALLLNVADLLQRWTSDRFIATRHRVTVPATEYLQKVPRRSIAFFINPDDEVMVESLDGKNRHPPIRARDYLEERFAATFQY